MSSLPLVDVGREVEAYRQEFNDAMASVLDSGNFILGKEVQQLEEQLCARTGAPHCVAMSSGTDALLLALIALKVGPGDEVITTPFTWVSSAEVVSILGATPRFVDIDLDTYLMDPCSLQAEIGPRTKAIIPVSIFGAMPDLQAIQKLAGSIPVIEDAAQSFGARRDGMLSCGADLLLSTTSFFPTKPLSCFGDGGAVFTNCKDMASTLRSLRVHGKDDISKKFTIVGTNARLDTLQAAVLLVKLRHFDILLAKRIRVAQKYTELIHQALEKDECLSRKYLATPVEPDPNGTHVYAVYTIRVLHGGAERRNRIQSSLRAQGISTAIYYAVPLHRQPAYRFEDQRPLPLTEKASGEVLSLPMHAHLEEEEIVRVVKALICALKESLYRCTECTHQCSPFV